MNRISLKIESADCNLLSQKITKDMDVSEKISNINLLNVLNKK